MEPDAATSSAQGSAPAGMPDDASDLRQSVAGAAGMIATDPSLANADISATTSQAAAGTIPAGGSTAYQTSSLTNAAAAAASSSTQATANANLAALASGLPQDASRESRISTRKARIETNRMAKMKPDKIDENATRRKVKVETEVKDAGKAKAQISTSSKRIETTKQSTTELVTNVRVGIVARESARRAEEAKKVEIWDRKRADEAAKSGEVNSDIQAQWENVLGMKGPYELNQGLVKQKDACEAFIANKNRLINEYVLELKAKDDEYVKELKRHAEEIDTLLERMESQYRTVQSTLREELEQIEKAFVEERSELIDMNSKEFESALQQRRDNESQYMFSRADRIEDHIKQLEQLRVRDAEEYNLVKIKLETDVQVLEQQLQQMRATYQLNMEKLEYNFQVLKKREEENGTILSTQKRKITRLTDHLNLLKAKMAKQEKTFHQEHVSLNDDYKRITEQFKELQKKFRHFQIADSKKFKEVWTMNEEVTRELMRKVLQADRIIHEQQLGLRWAPPAEDPFVSVDPFTLGQINETDDGSSAGDEVAGVLVEGPIGGDEVHKVAASLASKAKDHTHYSKTMKRMLELLCNEAGFLVEDKLQKLLAPLHRDEQSLMKLDSIFKALGIETMEDIEKLTSYFVARELPVADESPVIPLPQQLASSTDGADQEASAATAPADASQPGASEASAATTAPPATVPNAAVPPPTVPLVPTVDTTTLPDPNHATVLIHPNEVVKAIKKFVEDHRGDRLARKAPAPDPRDDNAADADTELDDDDTVDDDDDDHGSSKPTERKKAKTRTELQKEYWQRMSGIIDDKSYRIWTAVYAAMENYNAQLTERWQLSQEITSIGNQNNELKTLLRQYMSAKINDELLVPPTQVILAQAGMFQPARKVVS